MGEESVVGPDGTPEEYVSTSQVTQAFEVLKRQGQSVAVRGDSFDVGGDVSPSVNGQVVQPSGVQGVISDPKQFLNNLGLTPAQTKNIKSMIIGGGTGGVHKLLSKHIGDTPAALIGALLSSWVAQKII